MLEASLDDPESFADNAQKLFAAMAGRAARSASRRSSGSTAASSTTTRPAAHQGDIKVALAAANRNWSNIDPSIMGTLFERGLDPGKRSQLGAHYTDPDKIMLIVEPVVVEPLTREWEAVKAEIAQRCDASAKGTSDAARAQRRERGARRL